MRLVFAAIAIVTTIWTAALAADVRSGFVAVPGGRLFVETAGNGAPVVFLHDGILHRQSWDDQFPALADFYRLIRFDRRGFGQSTTATAAYSHVHDLEAIFAASHVDRAALVGCSSGAALALDYALAHPERVSSMILVGPVVRGLSFSDHFRSRGGRLSGADEPADAINYWTSIDPYYLSPESTAARKKVRALLATNPNDLHHDIFARAPAWRTLGRLHEISVPTLIVVGEQDIPDVHAHAGAIQAAIANPIRLVIPHAGHLVHLEQPDRFNALVRQFLEGKLK